MSTRTRKDRLLPVPPAAPPRRLPKGRDIDLCADPIASCGTSLPSAERLARERTRLSAVYSREREGDAGAAAPPVLLPDAASLELDEPARDLQSEAAALGLGGQAF